MHKRLAAVLGSAALALALFSLAISRPGEEGGANGPTRRLFPFPWREARSVRLERPGGTVRLDQAAGGEWRIRLPAGGDLLNQESVDALAALAALAWREPLANFGPGPAPAGPKIRLAVAASGGRSLALEIGEFAGRILAVTDLAEPGRPFGISRDLFPFLDWPEDRFREFFLFSPGFSARPREITVSPAGGGRSAPRLRLRRGDSGWRLEEPLSWPADEGRIDLLLRWLEKLRATSIEAEAAGDPGWFGFQPDSPHVEALYEESGRPIRRRVEFGGRNGNGGIYARVAGRRPIFAVPGETLSEISLDAAENYPKVWRDFYRRRTVNLAGRELPAALVIESLLPARTRLTLTAAEGKWSGRLEENGERHEFPVEAPDPADPMRPLTALLAGLSSLRIQSFLFDSPAEGEREGGSGLTAFPAWRFSCRGADGLALPTLTLYAADPGGLLPPGRPFPEGSAGPAEMIPPPGLSRLPGIAFTISGQAAILEAPGEIAYLLCRPPYRYRSRTLLEAEIGGWEGVEITVGERRTAYFREPGRRNEQWWRDGDRPEPLQDGNNAFVAMLLNLSRLRAEAWIAGDKAAPEKFGLDRPEITVIVYESFYAESEGKAGRNRRRFKLSAGKRAEGAGKGRFARLNDSGPVFLAPGDIIDSLTVDF
ncbi:MAG: DUF4340 domain-containing protein [Planctomycetota bacterium]|jgi:hypothetical protein|nr:DUF4340 domain-containing protein [Planctomycetota bacterium]